MVLGGIQTRVFHHQKQTSHRDASVKGEVVLDRHSWECTGTLYQDHLQKIRLSFACENLHLIRFEVRMLA